MRLWIERITDYYRPQTTKVCFKQAYKIFVNMLTEKMYMWFFSPVDLRQFLVHTDICFENIN